MDSGSDIEVLFGIGARVCHMTVLQCLLSRDFPEAIGTVMRVDVC